MTASLRVSAEILELRTRHPFIIARGGSSDYRTVWVKVTDKDGCEGWGEAAATKFYGETPESVLSAINLYATAMPSDPFDLEAAEAQWPRTANGELAMFTRPLNVQALLAGEPPAPLRSAERRPAGPDPQARRAGA